MAANALPPDDPDRTEEKVAAYLEGMAALADGRAPEAVERLSWAVAAGGYEYSIYRLGLARAFLAAGRLPEAMAAARQASEQRDLFDPRLDLELDRVRAKLVLAEVWEAMDRPDKAANQARQFLNQWREADRGLPDLEAAKNWPATPDRGRRHIRYQSDTEAYLGGRVILPGRAGKTHVAAKSLPSKSK